MLPHLTALSKSFQTGELNFSQITPDIQKTKFRLHAVADTDTPLKELEKDLNGRLSSCRIHFSDHDKEYVTGITKKYAKSIVQNIDERFPNSTMDVLDAFSIFNVEEFPPNSDSQQFIVFGNDEIATLKSHFGTSEEVVEQWDNFI